MALRKFIIERDIPGAGSLEREQLRGAAAKSNGVLRDLGPDIQWVESYVAADKTFCVYLAKDEAIIKKHAEISGFPASKITEVRKMIDPTTSTAPDPDCHCEGHCEERSDEAIPSRLDSTAGRLPRFARNDSKSIVIARAIIRVLTPSRRDG
jgi:hypothetical protein